MGSGRRESSTSVFPSILGSDGSIDLAGEGAVPEQGDTPITRPSGDGWVIDRDRRSLPPPPTAQVTTADRAAAAIKVPNAASTDDVHAEIADRYALGDYVSALSAAELQLGREPDDVVAGRYAESSREKLEVRYATRIGSLDYIFNCSVAKTKIKWLGLDPQAAFLLSLVDGQTTVEEVLDLCGMGRLEALRVFTELLDAKAIERIA